MAQLSSYTLYDFYVVSILSVVIITYLSEEVEAGIESAITYVYSEN